MNQFDALAKAMSDEDMKADSRRFEREHIVAFLRRPMKNGPCTVEREHLARCVERGEHLK